MKIVIVAGGTGGHLYPGLAVARALQGHEVLFVIRRGDLCRDILLKEGFHFEEIAGQGLPRTFSLKAFLFPIRLLQSWIEARQVLSRVCPDYVLGMGGYLSGPMILTAHAMGIKTLIHEQNVFPGLANRWLGRWADSVAVSFEESKAYFKKANVWVSGLPVRPEIGQVDPKAARLKLGLGLDKPVYLVFGGSLGAQKINSTVVEAWKLLLAKKRDFQVLHITGAKDFDRVQSRYQSIKVDAKVLPYCHEMAEAYAAADAVICRAGATTVAELLATKLKALLIPYPYASNNHQIYNAEVIVKAGLGECVIESDLSPEIVTQFVEACLVSLQTKSREVNLLDDAGRTIAAYLVRK